MPPAPLPIDDCLPEVIAALRSGNNVVLRAPTGAGKTTRVPPAILDAGLAANGKILLLQPRRLAARTCAQRIASERGVRLGDEVGYQVRFESRVSRQTRIQVVTEGILLRMLHDDPFLESVAAVVFDEFHERSLNSDLALAMTRRVQQTIRPELKLTVMSATLDPEPIARYLGGCPRVESLGRTYPVEIQYLEDPPSRPLAERAATAVEQILNRTAGDVLVFLPGSGEIRQTAKALVSLAAAHNLSVLPLYGDLSPEEQDAALAPAKRRKVVLATNVAETSLTIEGVTGVVDTGLARTLSFNPQIGIDRLELAPISRASADQRAGRAGRTEPGICLRLWPERTHPLRGEQTAPEIERLDLVGPVLQLRAWGESDLRAFPWFQAPRESALEAAETLLQRLDALDAQHQMTDLGRAISRLPVSPRLGRMLIEGDRLGHLASAALAAALLSERDPFMRSRGRPAARRAASGVVESDVLDRVAAIEAFEQQGVIESVVGTIHRGAARYLLRVRDQLLRSVRAEAQRPKGEMGNEQAVLRALLAAFPDRLVRRSKPGSPFGRMVGGRGVRLAAESAVREAPLYLAIDVDAGESESLVRQASAVDRAWLADEHLQTRTELEFDPSAQRVVARRRVVWEDLLLDETPAPLPVGDAVGRLLAAAVSESLEDVFPTDDTATRDYLNRVRSLSQWLPELDLPKLDDSQLRGLLPSLCFGRRSFDELRRAPWLGAIQGLLSPEQFQAVAREAPERLEVPSGSQIRLDYEPGKPRILAVRIQEIFGMLQTPTVARGRVRVLLHLLAPNGRPQQVTDDLASFWKTTYAQVRKDLRRRYPKHAWPEDPYQATAQRRPK